MITNFSFTTGDLLTLVADIVNLILLLIAIVGIFLTLHQIKQNYDVRKATFYKEIYLTLLCEKHIRDAFYLIEKSKFIFDGNFLGTQTEKDVDALLCFFDMICRLYFSKNLTKQEMHDFKYEFTMVYCNKEIQRYLDYIKDIYNQRQIQGMPFSSFLSYCKNYMLPHVDILKNEHSNPNKSVILDHDET